MNRKFSKVNLSFYPDNLDYINLPNDLVDVSDELFTEITNPPEGFTRGADKNGQPILVPITN